jgi:hypothetical protein
VLCLMPICFPPLRTVSCSIVCIGIVFCIAGWDNGESKWHVASCHDPGSPCPFWSPQ